VRQDVGDVVCHGLVMGVYEGVVGCKFCSCWLLGLACCCCAWGECAGWLGSGVVPFRVAVVRLSASSITSLTSAPSPSL